MGSPRRIAGPDAKNRSVLLDAAEQLLLEEGYAAVTSRRVAAKADLKPQLVHYYFRTMDDLFVAVFRRRAEIGLERQAEALTSEKPIQALWRFSTDPTGTALAMEFTSLASHRENIRTEIGRYSEQFRTSAIEALDVLMRRAGISPEVATPEAVVVLMTSVARVVNMERALGVSGGHEATLALVERELRRLEELL
jgi:AcrR family transcriptional regulator